MARPATDRNISWRHFGSGPGRHPLLGGDVAVLNGARTGELSVPLRCH